MFNDCRSNNKSFKVNLKEESNVSFKEMLLLLAWLNEKKTLRSNNQRSILFILQPESSCLITRKESLKSM